ncbi:MAG: NfeD family protein [Bryobacteraceae bacterium]
MNWWVWLLVGLLLLVAELVIPGGFYMVFFGAGALAVGLMTAYGYSGPAWMQWFLFSVLSITALALFRKPLLEKIRSSTLPSTEVDSLVGQSALVLEAMDVDRLGRAELRGASWTARNIGPAPLAAHQRCRVERVDGLTLLVKAEES